MKEHSTSINDAAGEGHRYVCRPFPFSEGFDLKLELLEILSESLGLGIEAFAGGSGSLLDLSIDLGKLGTALKSLPGGIMSKGGSELVKRLLARTARSRLHGDAEVMEELRADVIDRVYSANYPEAYQALAFVLEVNYGPFSAETTGQWQPLLERVKHFLPVKTTEEPTLSPEPD